MLLCHSSELPGTQLISMLTFFKIDLLVMIILGKTSSKHTPVVSGIVYKKKLR